MEELRKARNESIKLLLIAVLIIAGVCSVIAQFTELGNEFGFKAGLCCAATVRLWRGYQLIRQNRI